MADDVEPPAPQTLAHHGIGAEELDLLVKTVLLGDDEIEVGGGLLATLLAFAENL